MVTLGRVVAVVELDGNRLLVDKYNSSVDKSLSH